MSRIKEVLIDLLNRYEVEGLTIDDDLIDFADDTYLTNGRMVINVTLRESNDAE